jgi:sulfite exporter TauE/SafE/copper chaperone CopZ/plastocyanin
MTTLVTAELYIGGMTCINCQTRIQKVLESTRGVQEVEVSYASSSMQISYDSSILNQKQIAKLLQKSGYSLLNKQELDAQKQKLVGVGVAVLAGFLIFNALGLNSLAGEFPLAEQGMGLGMLFVIGLLTSIHCVAMCGGINISQCIPAVVNSSNPTTSSTSHAKKSKGQSKFLPSLSYNLGRVISYTLIGALVGLLGSAIAINDDFKGVIQIIAGIFMVIMALSMLGIIPNLSRFTPHLPAPLANLIQGIGRGKSPLIIGLLNGLMPCGPLQAMQLYALSTASPVEGALSMLVFSLGTVPLMFGLGLLSSVLTERFTKKLMVTGASLVMLLGLFMLSNGWTLQNLPAPPNPAVHIVSIFNSFTNGDLGAASNSNTSDSNNPKSSSGKDEAVLENGVQKVQSTLKASKYPAIKVQAGIPVRWEIEASKSTITGCNNRMVIPEYKIQHAFQVGTNVIEFTPTKPGTYRYSCWMGMVSSTITVE